VKRTGRAVRLALATVRTRSRLSVPSTFTLMRRHGGIQRVTGARGLKDAYRPRTQAIIQREQAETVIDPVTPARPAARRGLVEADDVERDDGRPDPESI